MLGADRVAGERHALQHQRRVALHQVLVDVGARVALVAVGDDELLLARARRARTPTCPGREARAPAAAHGRLLDLRQQASRAPCRSSARRSPDQSPGPGQDRLIENADPLGLGRLPRFAGEDPLRAAPSPASIRSPSRTAGEEWQKPRQTVSASETERSSRRSPSSRPSSSRSASTCASPVAAKHAVPVQTRTCRAPRGTSRSS